MSQPQRKIPLQYEEQTDGANWYMIVKVPFMKADCSKFKSDKIRFIPKCQSVKSPTVLNVKIEPRSVIVEIQKAPKVDEVYYVERTTEHPLLVDQCVYGIKDSLLMIKLKRGDESIAWTDYMGSDTVYQSINRMPLNHGHVPGGNTERIVLTVKNIKPTKKTFGSCPEAENALIDFDVEPNKVSLEVRLLPIEQHKLVNFFETHTEYALAVGKCSYDVHKDWIEINLKRK